MCGLWRSGGYRWPTEKMKLRDHFLDLLSAEQKLRNNCIGTEWIQNERRVMFTEINAQRISRGKSPITLQELINVESMASGHSDYSSKFALYCAELVLDDPMKETP